MERDSVQNIKIEHSKRKGVSSFVLSNDTPLLSCLLYTSDAADEL